MLKGIIGMNFEILFENLKAWWTMATGNLAQTLPMALFGMIGIFVVILIMMATVYGVSIFSMLLARGARKKAAKRAAKAAAKAEKQ